MMIDFLTTVAIVLCIFVVIQLVKVSTLIAEAKNERNRDTKVTDSENRLHRSLMLLFALALFAFYLWLLFKYKDHLLPPAASEHGMEIDDLFNFNWIVLNIVFVLCITLLFFFAFKYYKKEGRQALYYPVNHKLELIWTLVPAAVLSVIIFWGIVTWNKINDDPPANSLVIELYARQFDWTARYTGPDGQLGKANYRLIGGMNALGLDSSDSNVLDDILVKGTLHLPVNKPVNFICRSQDVIHSAYMPHFRAQMNCVPGMITQFHFIPTTTTEEMRQITGNPDFNYKLLCNKICGVAHYNMQMDILVESEEDYQKWLIEQPSVTEKGIITAEQVTTDDNHNDKTNLAENKSNTNIDQR